MSLLDEINNGTARQTVIHFPGGEHEDITEGFHSGTISLKKTLCEDNDDIDFVGCIASEFNATLEGVEDLSNIYIAVSQNIGEYNVKLFAGKVKDCPLQSDRLSRVLTAYDKFYDLSDVNVKSWWDNLAFPISIPNMLSSLLSYVGLTAASGLTVSQSFNVYKTIEVDSLAFSTVIKAICQICGGFGVIDAEGKFNIVYLSSDLPETSIQAMSGFELEQYSVKVIDKVQIQSEEDDIGGIYGTGTNCYRVTGNFLCYGKTAQDLNSICQTLYSKVSGKSWRPCTFNLGISNPLIGFDGMLHNISTSQGDNFNTYLFNIEYSGVQLFDQKCSCYGDEYRSEVNTDYNSEIINLLGKYFKIRKDVEGLGIQIGDTEQGLQNEIEATAAALSVQIGYLQDQIDGSEELIYTDHAPTLNNYPAWDWAESPIFDVTTFDSNGEMPWVYTDTSYRKHIRTMVYDTTSNVTYRFVQTDGVWNFEVLSNNDFAVVLQQLAELQVETDSISATVSQTTLNLENNYYNKVQTQSQINQTAEQINLSVSEKYVDKDNVTSAINLTKDTVKISGEKVNLTGAVSVNDNVKINTDGTLECVNAKVSGDVNSTNGVMDSVKLKGQIQFWYTSTYGMGASGYFDALHTENTGGDMPGLVCDMNLRVEGQLDVKYSAHFYSIANFSEATYFYKTSRFYGTVYNSSGGTVFTSDENAKHDIQSLDIEESAKFIYSLDAVEYKFNDNDSNRFHHGLKAQDVKRSMGNRDWGLYTDEKYTMENPMLDDDGNVLDEYGNIIPTKGLRYEELIADLIATVQSQNKRMVELEKIIKEKEN